MDHWRPEVVQWQTVVKIVPHDFYLLVFKPLHNCFPLIEVGSLKFFFFFFNAQNIAKVIECVCM